MAATRQPTRERAAHLGPERRRPLILDAAFDLFLRHGYDGTSMAAVAQAAGVTKPVVYDSFAGKEELFKALVQREEARVLGEIQAALPQVADPDDPEATLVEGFTAFLRAVAASPQAYRVIFRGEGGANAALTRRIERGREQQVEAVATLAKPWLQSRIDGDVDAASRLLGHLIVGLAEAGARAMLSEPRTWTPETLGRTLGQLAARGQAALWDEPRSGAKVKS
jgi:AcrR family transcriptional regulator